MTKYLITEAGDFKEGPDPDAWLGGVATLLEPVTALGGLGTANVVYYQRVVRGTAAVTGVTFQVGTSSGNVSVAVHASSGSGMGAAPGAQLATSGAVACPATGLQTISLGSTVTVTPGMWLALSCDNSTATFAGLTIGTGYTIHAHLVIRGNGHPAPATPIGLAGAGRRFQLFGS